MERAGKRDVHGEHDEQEQCHGGQGAPLEKAPRRVERRKGDRERHQKAGKGRQEIAELVLEECDRQEMHAHGHECRQEKEPLAGPVSAAPEGPKGRPASKG